MENFQEPRPIHGLVDAHRAAEALGVTVGQWRTWHNRKRAGIGPLSKIFPDPVAEDDTGSAENVSLNGSPIWTADSVRAYAEALSEYEPRGGRTPARLKAAEKAKP